MNATTTTATFFLAAALWAGAAFAHCDTPSGPVIPEALAALEAGDVTPLLKWIPPADEPEIKAAFAKTLAVRVQSPEAKELADRYFLETLVRIHRAGEGAPFTGIKDEPIKPIVALADQALADGSADAMIQRMSGHLAQAVGEKFQRALEAQAHKDDSVEAGRQYVEAYVTYVHYVQGVRNAIMSAGGHGHAAPHAQ
jgi:hypothetical protein